MSICPTCYWREGCKWGGLIGYEKNEHPENKICKHFDPDNEETREREMREAMEMLRSC